MTGVSATWQHLTPHSYRKGRFVEPQPAARGIVIAPMSLGEVVDNGFNLARRNFRYLARLGAWGIVVGYLLDALLSVPTADFSSALATTTSTFASSIGAGMAGLAMTHACARLIDPAGTAGLLSAGEAYRQSLNRLPALIGLFFVIVFAAIPLLVVFPLGIYVWNRWAISANAVILERIGPIAGIKRSWELTRHSWWHTFIVLLITGLAVGIIQGVVAGVLGAAIGAASYALNAPALRALGMAMIGAVLAIVVTPFPTAVGVVLYHELRARAEGLDLERRLLLAAPAE